MTETGIGPRSGNDNARVGSGLASSAYTSGVHEFDPPVSPEGVPEYFLGISSIDLSGGESRMQWRTGPWLSWDGRVVAVGSLGVLFDNILAYPMIEGSSIGCSMVSTEITVDSLRPIPVDIGPLTACGRLLARTADTAFAAADLFGPDGELLAVATQRGRYVPSRERPDYDYTRVAPGSSSSSLADLMWPAGGAPQMGADGRAALLIDTQLGNHMQAMHGGVSVLFSEWAAVQAVRAHDSQLDPASIRISYARPIPVGTVAAFETTVVHLGRSAANVHVVGRTETGKCGVLAAVTLH